MNLVNPYSYGGAPPLTPVTFGATGADGNQQSISGGGLIATFNASVDARRSMARTNPQKSPPGKRQMDFRLLDDAVVVVGIAAPASTVDQWPGFDNFAFGLYAATGDVYRNSSVIGSIAALSVGPWYSMTFDFATGAMSVYDASGSLLGTVTDAAFAGGIHWAAGSASGSGTRAIEIDPTPPNLRGGATDWDS